ncbi:hypothetical protein GTA08_BOTSDO11351 [Neofusicoccum parvum]|uniref:Uncharacterized protein n=1 Tax=Neofusicoccum parvum TaxID=310453 RepID=A0ACB5S780_9PEZI|nr:hypothetical protein GTA08_BOTSDO11351 [Neofusicoccum parvum]
MPSLTKKLIFHTKRRHTFAFLRRNPELLHELTPSTTALRALIPKITHALRPHPQLHLLTHPASSSTSALPPPPPSLPPLDATAAAPPLDGTQLSSLPPSAVPWPPQVCAAPLSTHHRLRCGHAVRTPFLSPCAANCAHVPRAAGAGALPPFVLGGFGCPACGDEGFAAEARGEWRGCEMAEEKDGHGLWCP